MKYLIDNFQDTLSLESKAIREGFGKGIVEAADNNENVVLLNADLPGSLKVEEFAKKYPQRYFQVGVAEQNMAGIGTGLAHYGKIPFISSFAAFSPGLNFSQIRLATMGHQNLKIVGSHYGLNTGPDGASAQMFEDVSMMKALSGITIINPADYNQAIQATVAISKVEGPQYLRVTREKFPVFFDPNSEFIIGKAQKLMEGNNVTVIATGSVVYETLMACVELSKSGIEADFLNLHTIKPLDSEAILNSASKTKRVVVVEENNVFGGVGETIARILGENLPTPIKVIGINDTFGESGSSSQLWEKYGLDKKSLVSKITEFISK